MSGSDCAKPWLCANGKCRSTGKCVNAGQRCEAYCGDLCTCGRGPESADLDAVDVEGMRAVEGRAS